MEPTPLARSRVPAGAAHLKRYAGTIEMDTFRIKLTTDEFSVLNETFPSSRGSGDIGKRAVEIIRYHFKNQNPGCSFVETPSGADLAVLPVGATMPMVLEITGTADPDIALSNSKCHRNPATPC